MQQRRDKVNFIEFTKRSEVVTGRIFQCKANLLKKNIVCCSETICRFFQLKKKSEGIFFFFEIKNLKFWHFLDFILFLFFQNRNMQGGRWDACQCADKDGKDIVRFCHLRKTKHILGCISKSPASRSQAAIISLCAVLVRPHLDSISRFCLPSIHWCIGESPTEATKMVRELDYMMYEERLRKIDLFNEEKARGEGAHLQLPNRRVQRIQRQVFSDIHK